MRSNLNKLGNNPVFLLGTSECNGLGVLRCFGRRGIPVYLFDEGHSMPHKMSRYCHYIKCPNFNVEDSAAADLMIEYAGKHKDKPVLISTSDRAALYEMHYRHHLKGKAHFISSEEKISQRLIYKDLFSEAAKETGIPSPKTLAPKSLPEARQACEQLGYPVVIKPRVSNVFVAAFGTKCFVVKNYNELLALWPKLTEIECPTVLQEVIPGDRIYMWYGYYGAGAKLVASCGYHKIRQYPPRVGSGSLVKILDMPELIVAADRLIRHIGYHGIVEPEFKFDPRDSTWKILEINARTSTQNRLPAAMGRDMEYLAYCEALGLPLEIKQDVPPYIWTESHCDLASAILDPDVTWQRWRSSRKGKKVYANFAWDDPLPALMLVTPALRMITSALLRRYMPRLHSRLSRKSVG